MFIDSHIDLTATVGWRRLLKDGADEDLGDHALKYRDGRQYPLLKGNVRPNQIALDISGHLLRTALRREIAGDIENEVHRIRRE